jgi:putative peptidoglycan lipid II flippase
LKRGRDKHGIDPGAHDGRKHIRTGLVLSFIQVLGLLLSVGQDAIAAKLFGARVEMDTYLEAWIVPVAIASIVSPGLQSALIPHFALTLAQKGAESAWEMAAEALLVALGFFAALALLGLVGSRQILGFVAAGARPETARLLLQIYAIGYGYAILSLLVALLSGLCNATGRFVFPAVLSNLSALVPVAGLLTLGRRLGVTSLPLSLVLGALIQTVILAWIIGHLGLRVPKIRRGVFRRLRPLLQVAVTVSVATVPLAMIAVAERHFGSELAEGSVAQLTYATKLVAAGFRVFAAGLGVMGLPLLSAYLARGERERFQRAFSFLFRLGCYTAVVGAVGLTLAGQPLVHVLFERGRFTHADTALVAACLRRSAWCLFYGVVFPTLNAALLSGRRAWILPVANAAGLCVYLAVAFGTLVPGGNPLGLGLAYAVGYNAILIPAYALLWREGLIGGRPLSMALWRCLLLGPLVYFPVWLCLRGLSLVASPAFPSLLVTAMVGGCLSLLGIAVLDGEMRDRVLAALRQPHVRNSQLEEEAADA